MKNTLVRKRHLQLISLLASSVLFYLLIVGKLNSAHEFCPYASVCFGVMSFNPGFTPFVYPVTVAFGILIAASSIFIGRRFCSYICPLGTMQEFLFKTNPRYKKNIKKRIIPAKIHFILSGFKYFILLFTALSSLFLVQYIYMSFCPVYAIAHPATFSYAAAITFTALFGAGYFIDRFWCRYACPYGALMNTFQYLGRLLKIPASKIYLNKDACISCKICSKNCPMGIDIEQSEVIEDPNCIHCMRCIRKCPKPDCLSHH